MKESKFSYVWLNPITNYVDWMIVMKKTLSGHKLKKLAVRGRQKILKIR